MFGFIKGLQEKFTGLSRYGKKFQAQDKKKKIVLMIIGVVIIVAISQFTAKEEKKKEKLPVRTQQQVYAQAKEDASKAQAIVVPGTKVNSQDIWMAEGQKKINQTEQVTNQLSNQVSQQKNQDDIRDQQIKDLNAKLDAMTARIAQQGDNTKVNSSASMSAAVIKPQPQIQEIDMDNSDDDGGGSITSPKIKPTQQQNGLNTNISLKDKKKTVSEYIPSNTVIKGNLIEGISANTGGNANSEPTPVLIQLTSLADLPNFFRSNVKNCRIGGSGYGDLSTERVKIRLDKLSCVLKNGNVIDIPVKGHVAGEDGKAGIRGVVVTHNGSVLAKAALAGTLSGLGNAAQTATQTQMISPVGVTNTINPNQAFGNAMAGGVSNGFNTLSQYYTNMLNQVTPAIEVSSGRNVDVILQDGVELKESLNSSVLSDDTPLPFNALNK